MSSSDIDTQYDAWLIEQSQLLRDRTFEKLDIENLIEELESLVRGEKSAVESLAIYFIASTGKQNINLSTIGRQK